MKPVQILPRDGETWYYGKVISDTEADSAFKTMLEKIEWRQDVTVIFGKSIITKRKVAWYASEPYSYRYSGSTKTALPFSEELLGLKKTVERVTGYQFNSCLLNLYHTGEEGVGWHSDAEKELVQHYPIASLSLGECRKFQLRHKKTSEVVSVDLEHGSVLVMAGTTNTDWQHRIAVSKKVKGPRISLTFRLMNHL